MSLAFLTLLLLLALGALTVAVWRLIRLQRRLAELATRAQALALNRTAEVAGNPEDSAVGRLEGALLTATVALRSSLDAVSARETRLRAVLAGMVEGVLVIDPEGVVLLSNSRAEELLGLPPGEEYVGRHLIELTRHPDLHELVRRVNESGRFEVPPATEITLDVSQQRVVLVTAAAIDSTTRLDDGFVLVFHDISELKRLERMRRDFVGNVSHELRTPLAAIGGYTETLLGGAIEDASVARRFLETIERHTGRLGRLVDDLLALSDLESGHTELRLTRVDSASVIQATFETLRQRAVLAGVRLHDSIEVDTPSLAADADRLEQALVNLVDNAIKYTPQGGSIMVGARGVAPDALPDVLAQAALDVSFVELSVADTGVGIPTADLPRLTERFYRVDKARSRELGGTGLGLAIVKHIVQAHGGAMQIESDLNQGTTVRLFLPASEGARAH